MQMTVPMLRGSVRPRRWLVVLCSVVLTVMLLWSALRSKEGGAGLVRWAKSSDASLERIFSVIAVTSPAHSPQRRQWQRIQWNRNILLLQTQSHFPLPKYVFKFCIGAEGLSAEMLSNVNKEQQTYGDVQLLDSPDYDEQDWTQIGAHGHSATTMKVLAAIQWATSSYDFQFFVRLGDDSYFRPERFFERVQQGLLPTSTACIGFNVPDPMVYNTSAGEVMAPYPSGMGFALTADVTAWLSLASDMLLLGGPEDGIVGTWFAGTQIQVHHVPNGFRDLHWKCWQGEDILVHCLRDETAWSMIDAEGNLPCDPKAA